MKKILLFFLLACTSLCVGAQVHNTLVEGKSGDNIRWVFDGHTLDLSTIKPRFEGTEMPDYDHKDAPWQKYAVSRVHFGSGITRIGACAFRGQKKLSDVIFETSEMQTIGWGAFLDCTQLSNIRIPDAVSTIETLAFARCSSLVTITIPDQCIVEDQAFISCTSLSDIDISPSAQLHNLIFATEMQEDGKLSHKLYNQLIRRLPAYVNYKTAPKYGISPEAVPDFVAIGQQTDTPSSPVDEVKGPPMVSRNNTYALVIGNENYRKGFASPVSYAIHDATVFGNYCEKMLGVPRANIHVVHDATKSVILDEELEWLQHIQDREEKRLILYYAGHGVPDNDHAKSYLLPTDVRGTHPERGIALDDLYQKISMLGFEQATILLDACFSGLDRQEGTVVEGERGVGERAVETKVPIGNLIVFAAAQGTERAQGYHQHGHGLFTYCLLQTMRQGGANNSFGYLFGNVKESVSKMSLELPLKLNQTPTIEASPTIGDNWRMFSF